MWWSVVCPHCREWVNVYLEEADGMPLSTPYHGLPNADEKCPGSGAPPDDYREQRPR